MFKVDSSVRAFDLEPISMLLSVDLPTVEPDTELILRFQAEMSSKIS